MKLQSFNENYLDELDPSLQRDHVRFFVLSVEMVVYLIVENALALSESLAASSTGHLSYSVHFSSVFCLKVPETAKIGFNFLIWGADFLLKF